MTTASIVEHFYVVEDIGTSLILSADQTTGCKSTPKAYRTKVQYRTYMEM